ncbi:altered inheritance of mitochondria protein 21 [Xylariaceae sp. FL0255]|nr:altered inheritance of mitochondria protein 21 [Xylariaceae sp. FL0255]
MSVATMSTPVVPPRPARSQDKAPASGSIPTIPPRPSKRFNRSVSPNPDRFAPSPLNESPFNNRSKRLSQSFLGEQLERSTSVELPSIGQEGQEYAAFEEKDQEAPDPVAPEQTRSVGEDVKLHAPKPTVAPIDAKQRVQAVTRTDSDKAASFGIGRPSSAEPLHSGARSLKKKASTTSQLSHHSELGEDEQGIPEIGQRVPMLAYAGDVQAPSPAPQRAPSVDSTKSSRHQARRTSSRNGFHDVPAGAYGLHGHGVESTDKLDKAWAEKHPESVQKEHYNHLRHRDHDYSMSSEDLNKIVRDTASRGAGYGSSGYIGSPSEHVGYHATAEYASRIATPQPSSLSQTIHVDEDNVIDAFAHPSNEQIGDDEDTGYYPILAADEVAKSTSPYELRSAVPPRHERHGSSDEPRSRPTSRPGSIYSPQPELRSTLLDDVEEYEPLFPEGDESGQKPKSQADKLKERSQRFPSRDIWEDAPNSVHSTAEVSTPEPSDRVKPREVPPRETETPAQAFARKQEELAEREAITPDSFLNRTQRPKSLTERPDIAKAQDLGARSQTRRFPSRDVWEDTPDSLQFTTTVSQPQTPANTTSEDAETSPVTTSKPVIPARPSKKQDSGDDSTSKPSVPGRPKPQVPARPSKFSSTTDPNDLEAVPRQKPVVPARPVGGKIAALQANLGLNDRLRLGPQAPKKEAPVTEEPPEEKEKAPLSDARKGRARGPQRRAPTKSSSPGVVDKSTPPPVASNGSAVLSFSMTRTLWSIDEEGTMTVDHFGTEKKQPEPKVEEVLPEEPIKEVKTEEIQVADEEPQPEAAEVPEPPELEQTEVEEPPATIEETRTLATNTAGESILQETVEKTEDGTDKVEKVANVDDTVDAA